MNVVVCLEHHFVRSPDGSVWTQIAFSHRFWHRYLEAFDGVRIVARVKDVPSPPSDHVRVDGPRVAMHAVPDYLGPWQYLLRARAVRSAVRGAVRPDDAIILRVGSQLASCLLPTLLRQGRPYAVEVVGDPWEVFSPGACRHVLRPLFRWHFARELRRACAHACAAAYVTEHALQQRYPVGTAYADGASWRRAPFATAASSVELPEESFLPRTDRFLGCMIPTRLVMVGSLAQAYKGTDIALAAVARCVQAGLDARLTVVGDGKHRKELERQAAALGVGDRVLFRGQLSQGAAVREELDRAEVFLMPSRTEGLPRAMVEAMARGLPCIGSNVGGIPELLPPEDLVPPGDAEALAAKIREVVASPMRMREMSVRNFRRAMDFREEALRDRRLEFYRFVRTETERWARRGLSPSPVGYFDVSVGDYQKIGSWAQ